MKNRIRIPLTWLAALSLALLLSSGLNAAQETITSPAQAEATAAGDAQQALRANLLLQDQVRTLQRTLENYQQQAEADARRGEETLAARFGAIERSLDEQRQRELESSRTMMFAAGAFAVAGLVIILVTAWLQLRTVQRLTEVGASLRLGSSAAFPLALTEGLTPGESVVARSKQRYLEEMQRLQHRVRELEHAGMAAKPRPGDGGTPGEMPPASGPLTSSPPAVAPTDSNSASEVSVLLGKGQTYLNLDQPEKALACFEEALALDPDHVETLLKRGAALERMQRFDDAIAVYDRIIGLDERQTTAYLLKGGVFNRLKRFSDALACYDQALKTQSQRKA